MAQQSTMVLHSRGCWLLCHDLDSGAEFFGEDSAFYSNSTRFCQHCATYQVKCLNKHLIDILMHTGTYMYKQTPQNNTHTVTSPVLNWVQCSVIPLKDCALGWLSLSFPAWTPLWQCERENACHSFSHKSQATVNYYTIPTCSHKFALYDTNATQMYYSVYEYYVPHLFSTKEGV